MPATSAARNRLLFFLFLVQPFTVLMKQTRQAVCAVKQSIFLRCLWSNSFDEKYFFIKLFVENLANSLMMIVTLPNFGGLFLIFTNVLLGVA